MTIGDKIKIARENANLTQEELGRKCGTTKQTIYKYESGVVTNIPIDRIEMIASVVGVSSASLLGWDETLAMDPVEDGNRSPSAQELTEGEALMLELFRQVPEDRQDYVLEMIRLAVKI